VENPEAYLQNSRYCLRLAQSAQGEEKALFLDLALQWATMSGPDALTDFYRATDLEQPTDSSASPIT
jgi:hypothetical protein